MITNIFNNYESNTNSMHNFFLFHVDYEQTEAEQGRITSVPDPKIEWSLFFRGWTMYAQARD